MLEQREDACLSHQATGKFAIRTRYFKNFQRDAALQRFVFGGIHHTHSAARDLAQEPVACAAQVRKPCAVAQPRQRFVRNMSHGASRPKTVLASHRNSSSVPQSSRNRSSAILRNSRRAQPRALVTSVTLIPCAAASRSYEISSSPSRS